MSLFFQTFYLHRYAAHRMFTMSKTWEKIFNFMSWIFQGSSYLSPYAYGAMHRMHHAFADTENDPHSPKFDTNIFTMMWRTKGIYHAIFRRTATIDPKYLKDLPDWHSFEKFASHKLVRLSWIFAYIAFYVAFATQWWMFLLLPLHFAMGPLHGAIINWFAHKYGYRNFEVKDTSKNFLPFDFLMMGESYHNNHHKRGTNPNFGYRWFEIDPTYISIKVLHFLKIIKIKPVGNREY